MAISYAETIITLLDNLEFQLYLYMVLLIILLFLITHIVSLQSIYSYNATLQIKLSLN